ncbi:MAG: hypothetical protein GKR90_17910 [Pseudomonadales bacterium]|nr:hypothetical protein [Pseudomonadales bacterium]
MSDGLCHLCLAGPSLHKVSGYAVWVCSKCWREAAIGWPERWEATLFAALGRASLLIPDRNESGRLPREYSPPGDFAL